MKQKYYIYAVILLILIISISLYNQQSRDTWPPPNVVKEHGESGQWVLVNELAILGSSQDVKSLVAEFDGEITVEVPETGTYQVKFPVSSLEELDIIANKLREKEPGIQVMYVIVMRPTGPGEPQ